MVTLLLSATIISIYANLDIEEYEYFNLLRIKNCLAFFCNLKVNRSLNCTLLSLHSLKLFDVIENILKSEAERCVVCCAVIELRAKLALLRSLKPYATTL